MNISFLLNQFFFSNFEFESSDLISKSCYSLCHAASFTAHSIQQERFANPSYMYVAVQTVTVEDKTSAVVVWGAHAAGDNRATWNHDAVFAGLYFFGSMHAPYSLH